MRHRHQFLTVSALLVLSVAVLVLPGCEREQRIETAWPTVTRERVVQPTEIAAVWPLTGLPATERKATQRRILEVTLDDTGTARPQAGLQGADVVYEVLSEEGVTRYAALFHSVDPAVVGPVRTPSLPDARIAKQWDAVMVHAGDGSVDERVRALGVKEWDAAKGDAGFFRDDARRSPFDLFVRPADARKVVAQRFPGSQDVEPFAFSASVEGTHTAVAEISLPFSSVTLAGWRYDRKSRTYTRSIGDEVQEDAVTEKPVTARNVVVIRAKTNVTFGRDAARTRRLDVTLDGGGKVTLFRDGIALNGTWQAAADGQPTLRAADGTRLKFAPGNTWIEVVPTSVNITLR